MKTQSLTEKAVLRRPSCYFRHPTPMLSAAWPSTDAAGRHNIERQSRDRGPSQKVLLIHRVLLPALIMWDLWKPNSDRTTRTFVDCSVECMTNASQRNESGVIVLKVQYLIQRLTLITARPQKARERHTTLKLHDRWMRKVQFKPVAAEVYSV